MKRFFKLFGLLTVGLVGIVACAPTPTPTRLPTSTSIPTVVAIATVAATATNTPEPSATWILIPTNTATPTNTQTATRTLTPSVTPTALGDIELVDLLEESKNGFGVNLKFLRLYGLRGAYSCNSPLIQIEYENQKFLRCASWFPAKDYREGNADNVKYLLTMTNPTQLVDERGNPLEADAPREDGIVYFRKRDGTHIAMPIVYPRFYKGVEVVPIMEWGGGFDKHVLTGWQIWLINLKTKEVVTKIENPFVSIEDVRSIAFNPESGFYEVVNLYGDAAVGTGKTVGLKLTHPLQPFGFVEGMRIYKFQKEDISRFQKIFDWLKQVSPNWYDYVLNQRPVDIYFDSSLVDMGWAGSAYCCSRTIFRGNVGQINFAARPPDDPESDLWYLLTLIHEAAHVQDFRARKFEDLKGVAACRAAERSAVEMERAFQSDLLNAPPDEKTRSDGARFLEVLEDILAKGTFDWNPACVEK